jgi:hypothetical protein
MQILSFAPWQLSIWPLVCHVRFTSATWPADIRYEQTVAVTNGPIGDIAPGSRPRAAS